jgi:predicted Fe-Mo cluster-binding NifX family protein
MKIAITSQNFRSITQHAGKSRRFLIFEQDPVSGKPMETGRLDLPREMSMHEFRGEDHPLFKVDILVTGSGGEGFIRRMAQAGVQVVVTSEKDPYTASEAILNGTPLPPPEPHTHDHGHIDVIMPRL